MVLKLEKPALNGMFQINILSIFILQKKNILSLFFHLIIKKIYITLIMKEKIILAFHYLNFLQSKNR